MKSSVFLSTILILLCSPLLSSGRHVAGIDCRFVTREPARRVYFYDASGDERQLLELRQRLLNYGAYHVNVFPPSHLVCELPEAVSTLEVARGSGIAAFEERDIDQARANEVAPWVNWLRECYGLAQSKIEPDEPAREMLRAVRESNIRTDSVGVVDPSVIEQSILDRVTHEGAVIRGIDQNSEFMLGDIVINLILPESNYNRENWTEYEKSQAIKGAISGITRWQDLFPHAPMNLIFRIIEDVGTYYEPSHMDFEIHEKWILDVMRTIGYSYSSWTAPQVVDKFHQDVLAYYAADWIFTAFIIRARGMDNYMIEGTNFVTYAIRGGPYMILPFPTGPYSYRMDHSFVTSLCVQHDVGHIFWAMDEWELAQGWSCENRCGYLNYANNNKIEEYILEYIPTNHCIGICEPCIMDIPEKQWGRTACPYTAGHMGIVDWDDNGIPDIFDSPPIAEFVGGPAETLVADNFTVRATLKSVPIPNRNCKQDSTTWIDYACDLKDVVMDINGFGNIYLLPEDGRWDEVEEEIVIPLTSLSVGETSVELYIRTTVGCKSPARIKRIFRAGLSYSLFNTEANNDGINLTWFMVGETFNAVFDLYRIETRDGASDTVLVAADLKPSGEAEEQFLPFSYFDSDVEPAEIYWYFIRGTYTLAIQGGEPEEFVTDSEVFKAETILPVPKGDMLSYPTPNPFHTSTRFSIIIPKKFSGGTVQSISPAGTGPARGSALEWEVASELEVKVYDVAGRPIKTVLRENYFGTTVTTSWDGTNDRNEPVPSGIYFLTVTVGSNTQARKVTVLR